MRSIMQQKDGTCYLCKLFNDDYRVQTVQEHHVFNAANRKLSEKFGLKVYLCLQHHTEGPEAVHNNAFNMNALKQLGQKTFEVNYPELDFRKIFGKNYLEVDRNE